MNIAFFTIPKVEVKYLYSDMTVRQALEKMHNSGFSAIPVLDRDGHYVGTLSEGDLLWCIVKGEGGEPHTLAIEYLETISLKDVKYNRLNTPVPITASIEDLIMRAMQTNFVPIVDDRNLFIGIVTRRAIIKHFYDKNIASEELEFNPEAVFRC